MRFNRHQKIGVAFLAIPFFAMLVMIGMNMRNISYQEYRIAIEGYDPRDLLKGHYLIFRYKWPADVEKKTAYECACLAGDPLVPVVTFGACPQAKTAPADCRAFIRLAESGDHSQPYESARRFFIPEAHAGRLENMLRSGKHDFAVGVVPQDNGMVQLKELYIDGVPLDEFLKMPAAEGALQ